MFCSFCDNLNGSCLKSFITKEIKVSESGGRQINRFLYYFRFCATLALDLDRVHNGRYRRRSRSSCLGLLVVLGLLYRSSNSDRDWHHRVTLRHPLRFYPEMFHSAQVQPEPATAKLPTTKSEPTAQPPTVSELPATTQPTESEQPAAKLDRIKTILINIKWKDELALLSNICSPPIVWRVPILCKHDRWKTHSSPPRLLAPSHSYL